MALKLKGSTSGFVAIDCAAEGGNNTLILPSDNGVAGAIWANNVDTAGVATCTSVTINKNGDLTVPGTVSVGGTLTYEDVTNVDVVGLVTAAQGVRINGGGLSIIGITTGLSVTGVATFAGQLNLNSNMQFTAADPQLEFNSGGPRFRVPTSNTLTIHTGGGFGSTSLERLRITSAGLVGIGTDTPQGNLDIQTSGIGSGAKLQIRDGNTTGNVKFNAVNSAGSSNVSLEIAATDTLFFNGGTERARITSDGNLGLGDNAPSNFTNYTNLSIHGASGGVLVFGDDGTDEWEIYGGDGALRVYDRANTSERFRITDAGRVLIGTTTEGAADADNLTVADSGSAGITIRSGTSAAGGLYFSDATSGAAESDGAVIYNHSSKFLAFYANESERLRISSTGLVGIGTDNPTEDLHIGSNSPYILLDDYDNSRKWTIKGTAWFAIDDTTAGSERLRIDSSGDLLLGATSFSGFGGSDRRFLINGSSNARFEFGVGGSQIGGLYADANQLVVYTSGSDYMSLQTAGTERLRLFADGGQQTVLGSEISHKSGGSTLVYSDNQRYDIDDSTNAYHVMKTWTADKGGSFDLEVSMMIESGTYYYSYIVYNATRSARVNADGTGSDSSNCKWTDHLVAGQTSSVHAFRRFKITCGASMGQVRAGDTLQLQMASTNINGALVTGNGQSLRARALRIYSTTGNPGTGGASGAGYNATTNTRNCCYWWLDRNGNLSSFDAGTQSTAVAFNRLVESQNFSAADWDSGVVTIVQSGVYLLSASVYSTTGGAAFTQGWWIVDGSRHTGGDYVIGTSNTIVSMTGFMYLTAGQTVGFHPHDSGTTLQINDNAFHTYFKGCLINATNTADVPANF